MDRNMTDELLLSSKEILDRAIMEYKPYAICLLLSGGNDSMAALHACKELGIKPDFIIHGVTGTGIKDTHDFVKKVVEKSGIKYLEANAGDAYLNYVFRKGFFGVGRNSHTFSYHLLKADPFRKAVSANIRQGKRGRPVLMVSGTRRQESENRMKTMVNPIKRENSTQNIWVAAINEWPNHAPKDYLESNSIEINPVSKLLCRSGECMCGTMQTMGDGIEASALFPSWGEWWRGVRKAVKEKGFTWDWSEPMPKSLAMEKKGQINMFEPMCSGCKINFEKRQHEQV